MKSKHSRFFVLLISHWANDGYSLVLPVLLIFISIKFSLNTIEVAAVITVYTMTTAIFQLPIAFLADYFGKSKQILAAGLFGFSASLIGYSWSPNYFWLLLFAVLAGICFSGYHPISMNFLTHLYAERKGFSLGIYMVAGSIGAATIPIIIGAFNENWQLAVYFLTIPGIIISLWIIFAFDNKNDCMQKNSSLSKILRMTLTNPMLLLLTTFGGINQMVYWGCITFIPLYFVHHYGWSSAAVGTLLGFFHFSAIISQTLCGYLSDIYGRNTLLLISSVIIAGAAIMCSLVGSSFWSIIFTVMIGSAVLALRPLVNAKVADIVPFETRSTAIGLNFTFSQGLGAIAPILGGYIQQIYSYQAVFLIYGLIVLFSCGILLFFFRLEKSKLIKEKMNLTTG
ncbi:MAG: MFS transporter [Bacillota bacterium]|nr:MFS transporter [Bacillota bacterium]